MQGESEEYNIIDAWADILSMFEILKGMSERSELILCIYKYKKTITKNWKESRDEVPKSIQTRIVRMVTKVKDHPYFFLSSVFGWLFTRHFKLSLSSLVMMTKK